MDGPLPWYVAHLTSDTIDDIVLGAYTDITDSLPPFHSSDTAYVLLYRGGNQLYGKDTVSEDTSAFLFPIVPYVNDILSATQGDFRGVGRDDLIVSHFDDCWYYRNDPPFSIEKFAQEIHGDTFFVEPLLGINGTSNAIPPNNFPMRAFPKKAGDSSVDLLVTGFIDSGSNKASIYFFRGGPEFGSHRITIDSATFVITHPQYSFGTDPNEDWPQSIADAGDMTGTGNHVLFTTARNDGGDYWWDVSYVTGEALDNKIDIWNSSPFSEGISGDTLTANDDSLEDYLFSLGWPNAPNGISTAGAMWLMYGSKNIPVHLNPQFADVKSIPQQDGAGITFAPNPITKSWSVATIIWPVSEEADLCVYDLLGTAVQTEKIRLLGGPEQQRIYFPNLAAGMYVVELHGASGVARAKLVVVH